MSAAQTATVRFDDPDQLVDLADALEAAGWTVTRYGVPVYVTTYDDDGNRVDSSEYSRYGIAAVGPGDRVLRIEENL